MAASPVGRTATIGRVRRVRPPRSVAGLGDIADCVGATPAPRFGLNHSHGHRNTLHRPISPTKLIF